MTKTFSRDGVRFQYPTNWALDAEADEDGVGGWAVTAESPATAFVTVALRPDAAGPAELVAEAMAALASEYADIEREPAADTLAGRPAVGFDFDFLSVDVTVTGWVRAVATPAGPVLVLCQVGEYDRDLNEPVLRAVCASLAVPAPI